DNENDEKDKSEDDSSPKEVNTAGQHVNTDSPEVNIGRFILNTGDPSVNTASSYDLDSPKDMFKLGASHTLKATNVEFFSDEDEPKVDLGNILNSYTVPTTPNTRIQKDHPIKNVIGDEKVIYSVRVWILVDLPIGKRAIGTKWVFRNKKDERGIVIRNKARLVAQGHRKEEVIDYEEFFALVARIKALRLFLAYAYFMGFLVYQMDVKSAFLYGTIEEEVYVTQPPVFKDPDNPNKVYKVVKALYGLHQAPRAWYETLANYLLGNGFQRGKIDQTLFIKRQKGEIFLVQVYVDDIIFGSTNKELCTGFKKLMKDNVKSKMLRCIHLQPEAEYVAAAIMLYKYSGFKTNCWIRIQALVDKKRVIVTESSIRRDLHLDDAEGTDCLPTATIFEELMRMGYEKPSQKLTFYKAFFSPQWKYFIHTITQCLSAKSTAWNEFSSSMASLIICLETNQKFNLSKYIFDAMVKHLDGGVCHTPPRRKCGA
ncbi:putative ribonuclease H-like domain-containing protein, partial [Tanacetum coccineum]